jgi:hypothetical protein
MLGHVNLLGKLGHVEYMLGMVEHIGTCVFVGKWERLENVYSLGKVGHVRAEISAGKDRIDYKKCIC